MSDPTRAYPPDPNHDTRTGTAEHDSSMAGEIAAPAGYELLEELGRGGMGVVFRARDLDLGREVAIKILQTHYAPNSSSGHRFVEEARITGRLQHPGIPAIYRVGSLPDGRPFLAMKLIGGQTLEEKIKERSTVPSESGPGLTPFEKAAHGMLDRLDAVLRRGRFLAVFEHVAQAVAYAHQEGVIHRDLKPSNVMVGAFGEVQVMDWGLAKYADRKPAAPARTDSDSVGTVDYTPDPAFGGLRGDATLAGSVLGTPAYMPPEQAIGAIDKIGKPSDVFGLGAILCVILTGDPPYVGETVEASRQLAALAKQGDALARLDASGAEPELIALAKRCLAPDPIDRPRDAGEVAAAVAALRADSEQRARQAEMDFARAEVKSTEERKRRRVLRALAFSLLGLLTVAVGAAWWIDSVRSQRFADQQADELQRMADFKVRRAELRSRQLTTERDVHAALNEAQILRDEGIKQTDDPARWGLTLLTARSALKRAEALLASGEPTDDLRGQVAAADQALTRDEHDCTLLSELDRIADSNEIRLMIPVPFSAVTSRRYASAFRKRGIDLLVAPVGESVSWLKSHPHRGRLLIAIRNWHLSYPPWDSESVFNVRLAEAVAASAAVAGLPAVAALAEDPERKLARLLQDSGPSSRLKTLLAALTEDPFVREWWNAVAKKDTAILQKLAARPELQRMSSRELSSLADGLASDSKLTPVLDEFLERVLERFPGEFWVHVRTALQAERGHVGQNPRDREARYEATVRHFTAAIAARPNSAIARSMLGMVILEKNHDIPAAIRMFQAAAEVEPTSPWPHLFMAMMSIEQGKWSDAMASGQKCVQADPDIGYFMLSSMTAFLFEHRPRQPGRSKPPSPAEIDAFVNGLVAARPDHPGGYYLLGQHQLARDDARAALATFRKAQAMPAPDYTGRMLINSQIQQLESLARWEPKVEAVIRGEIELKSPSENLDFAAYCARFDKKYARAARFIEKSLKTEPALIDSWMQTGTFAGYAVQAGFGNGADAADLTADERRAFRKLALAWLRETVKRSRKNTVSALGDYFYSLDSLAPVRDSKQRAMLPTDEQDEWIAFWLEVAPKMSDLKPGKTDLDGAPPPRPAKRP